MSSCPAQAIEDSFTIPGEREREIASKMSNFLAQSLEGSYKNPGERKRKRERVLA